MMAYRIWNEIPNDFHNIQLHEFVIMPNYIHGIIEITSSIPAIVRSFKRHTTIECVKMVKGFQE